MVLPEGGFCGVEFFPLGSVLLVVAIGDFHGGHLALIDAVHELSRRFISSYGQYRFIGNAGAILTLWLPDSSPIFDKKRAVQPICVIQRGLRAKA